MPGILNPGITQSHLDAKTSRRILDLAKEQQEEEEEGDNGITGTDNQASSVAGPSRLPVAMQDDEEELSEDEEYEDENFGDEEYTELVSEIQACCHTIGRELMAVTIHQNIDEGDQAILESFMPNGGGTRNLADLIMEKIQAREAGEDQAAAGSYSTSHRVFLTANAYTSCSPRSSERSRTRSKGSRGV